MAGREDDGNDEGQSAVPHISKQNDENRVLNGKNFVEVNEDDEGDVSDISEEEGNSASSDQQKTRPKKKVKKKRRSKSFNSNDEETTSSDEDVSAIVANSKSKVENINVNDLSWIMWLWYYVTAVSMGTFHFAEYLGEKLADFFGITSPKYQYVIDEYYRMKQEEEKEKEAAQREEEFVQQKKMEQLSKLEVGMDGAEATGETELSKL